MKGNAVRLFEHIKLLQRGVKIAEEGSIAKGSSKNLRRGLNGERGNRVRVALLGATSAGKTTLIRRLLSDSAGKISSKPETACLVVHSFSRVENIVLKFKDGIVDFGDRDKSSSFCAFAREFDFFACFDRVSNTSWLPHEKEITKEFSREKILEFFAKVNEYDNVFESIKWNHKESRSEYSLSDLMEVYDLPGFGGKEVHDETASDALRNEDFDILIYLIDTSKGILSDDEKNHLKTLQNFLKSKPFVKMYWAYQKPLSDGTEIDWGEAKENIDASLDKMEVVISASLLDLTGKADSLEDDVCERMLRDVLRPYFVEAGKMYLNGLYSEPLLHGDLKFDFENSDSKKVISAILEVIDGESKSQTITLDEASKIVLERLGNPKVLNKDNGQSFLAVENQVTYIFGKLKKWCEESIPRMIDDKCDECVDIDRSDKEIALEKMECRLWESAQKIVKAIASDSDKGYVSVDKIRNFTKNGNYADPDLHTLAYDMQIYQMLKDYGNVRSYIMKPIADSLRESIKSEIDAIEDYSDDEL